MPDLGTAHHRGHRGRSRQHERGSLLSTLLVILVIFVAASSAALLAFHHFSFSQLAYNQQKAREASESAAAMAIARLGVEPAFGADPAVPHGVRYEDEAQAQGVVTFSPGQALEEQVPLSTNNTSDDSRDASGLRLPAHTAQILARGWFRGAVATTEVLLYVPDCPLALAASGTLHSKGALWVSGVRELQRVTGDPESLRAADMRLVSVVSNGTDGTASLVGVDLEPGSSGLSQDEVVIRGDVDAAARVRLFPQARVLGAIRQETSPVPIPEVNVSEQLERCFDGEQESMSTSLDALHPPYRIGWLVAHSGSIVLPGDVVLDGGILSVRGDLTIQGSVRGQGAIFTEGTLTIKGGASSLSTDSNVALLAKGDLVLQGVGRKSSFFQGLVYSEGNVTAANVTVLGSLIAHGPDGDPTRGNIDLENVRVLHAPLFNSLRAGLICHSRCDDDLSVFMASARRDKSTGSLLFRLQAFTLVARRSGNTLTRIPIEALRDTAPAGGFAPPDPARNGSFTRAEVEAAIYCLDARFSPTLPGNPAGHSILNSNVGDNSRGIITRYLNSIERGDRQDASVLVLDPNRFLRPSDQMRALIWRSI